MDNFAFSREVLSKEFVDGNRELFSMNYYEALRLFDQPFDPDFDLFLKMEDLGLLRFFVAKKDGELAGYCSFIVQSDPHSKKSLQAHGEAMFLKKEFRGQGVATSFLNWCDDQLRREGIDNVYRNAQPNSKIYKILEGLGYMPIETQMARKLQEKMEG